MGFWDALLGRAPEKRMITIQSVYGAEGQRLADMIGIVGSNVDLPMVSTDTALQVPAFCCAHGFLSRGLASLPLHLFKDDGESAEKVDKGLAVLLRDAPNPELTSFDWRLWMWSQVFSGGRALTWIERNANRQPVALWPMDPAKVRIERRNGRMLYFYDGQAAAYTADEVIDMAWMRRPDGVGHWGPVQRGAKALQRALAMMDYSARLFAKGGVPPLTLVGPMGTTADTLKRATEQVNQALKVAQEQNIPMVQLPSGYELKPIGFNPHDAEGVATAKAVNLDIARLFNLPPVFIQDLENSTFTNSEQQDLQLVKHVFVDWCVAFEQQLNLKLFGQTRADRYVKHNVDGLLRGDFKSRIEAIARSVQTALLTPNEGRSLLDLPKSKTEQADQLFMQGATVPIEKAGEAPPPAGGGAAGGADNQDGGNADGN